MIDFLPMTRAECSKLGWQQLDIIIVTGDAYVDHHAFGAAIIGRYLLANGYKVGIISQPNWRSEKDFLALGRPKLFFGVTAGNMDSMVNHYTAQRKIRSDDNYSPNGKAGLRPDRATIVYTQRLQQLFKGVPIIIGGIEASLRRIPHYDYWQDKVRNSLLFDSKASMLVYGMAEKTNLEVANRLKKGEDIKQMNNIPGTVVAVSECPSDAYLLPSAEESVEPDTFLEMNRMFYQNFTSKAIYQQFGNRFLKHNPPQQPLSVAEIDFIYNLNFSRKPHPIYKGKTIPAYEQIKESITSHRGCFGGCNFCSLYLHQGKEIRSRSETSIMEEIKKLVKQDYFRGTITDIGGPSANMYGITCEIENCARTSCLMPSVCPHLDTSHNHYKCLLEKGRGVAGVKNLFVSSGLRVDLAIKDEQFMEHLALYYTGGRIKVAPEHNSPPVLKAMNKQKFSDYESFQKIFTAKCRQIGKNYPVVPYLMVGHPGCTLDDAIELAVYLKNNNLQLESIQEFTPTPMTISTAMYFTGKDFFTGEPIYVPKGREVRLQKALAQWFIPDNKKYVIESLKKANRTDLIPFFFD